MYSFSYLEPVCCSMSGSNCCFLTCIQVSQEAGQVVWYSHVFQNFPQFIVIHTVKGFGIVNKAEIMFFWNSLAFLMIQWLLAIWSLVPLPILKPAWTSGSSLKKETHRHTHIHIRQNRWRNFWGTFSYMWPHTSIKSWIRRSRVDARREMRTSRRFFTWPAP